MKTIFLISGKMGSGKNTLTDMFMEEYKERYSVEHMFFAKPLKDMAKKTFSAFSQYMNSYIDKLSADLKQRYGYDHILNYKLKMLKIKNENWYEDKTDITRILIQTLGTDIIRDNVNQNYWIHLAGSHIISSKNDTFIISDWRFPNEYYELFNYLMHNDWDQEYKFVLINIIRPGLVSGEMIHDHESENALNEFTDYNHVIINDCTLEELKTKIKNEVLKHY